MAPKKKPAARNAFYFFMEEVHRVQKLKSMHEASNAAGKLWEKMDARARAPYEALAIKARNCTEKMTTSGVPIKDSIRWQREQEQNKKRIDQEIENLVRELSLDPQGALTEHKFYLLHINCLVRTMRQEVVPAEIALSEFSIREGVTRVYSTFLNLAPIPQGYCQEASEVSRKTHKIPLPDSRDFSKLRPMCDDATECMMNIRKICFGMSLDDYDDGNYRDLPPLYCQVNELMIVKECLVMIMNHSDTRGSATIYPIDNLLFYLQKATSTLKGETGIPTLSLIRDEFDKDKFMYVPNISCEFHEEEDLAQYCSRSKVRRWAYLISDYICKDLDIELIPDRHCQPAAKTLNFEVSDYDLGTSGFSQSSLSSTSSIWDAPKAFDPDKASSSASSASTGAIPRMPMPRAEHYLEDDDEKRSPPDQGLEFVKVQEKEEPPNFSPTRFSTSPPSCSSTNYSTGLPSHGPTNFSTFTRATRPPSGYGPHNTLTLGPRRQGLPSPLIASVCSNPLSVATQSYPPPYRGPPAFHGHHHGPLRGEFHRAPRPNFSTPPPNLVTAPPFRSMNHITRPTASNNTADHHTIVILDLNDGAQPRYPKNQRAWRQFANPPSQYPVPNSSTYFDARSSYFNSNSSAYSNVNSSTFSNANSSTSSNVNLSTFSNANSSTYSNVNPPLYPNANSSTYSNVNPPLYSNANSSTNSNVNPPLYSIANYAPAEGEADVKPVIVKSEIVDPNFEQQQQQQQPPLPSQVLQLPPPPPPPPEQQEIPLPPQEQLEDTRKRTWQDTQIDVSKIKKEKEDEYDANIKIKQEPVEPEVNNGNQELLVSPLVRVKQEPKSDDEKEEKPFKLIKIDIPGEAKTPTFGRLIRVDIPQD